MKFARAALALVCILGLVEGDPPHPTNLRKVESQEQAGRVLQGKNGQGKSNGNRPDEIPASDRAREKSRRFKDETQLAQQEIDDTEEHEESDEQGHRYKVKNMKVRTRKVRVQLKKGKAEITAIECFPGNAAEGKAAEVLVTFVEPLDQSTISDLFPAASTLIIDATEFGECDLGGKLDLGVDNGFQDDGKDGFLVVGEAELSNDGLSALVKGKGGSWFDQFEVFHYEGEAIPGDIIDDTGEGRMLSATGCGSGSLIESNTVSLGITPQFPLACSECTPVAEVGADSFCLNVHDSGLRSFSVDYSFVDMKLDFVFETVMDIKTEANIWIKFLPSDYPGNEAEAQFFKDLFPPTKIAALPFGTTLDSFGANDMPVADIGLYARVELVIEGKHNLAGEALMYKLYAGYDTGRKVTQFSIGTSGTTTTLLENGAGRGAYYGLEKTEESYLDSSLFIGLRPEIAVKSRTIYADLSMMIGLDGRFRVHNLSASSTYLPASCTYELCQEECKTSHTFQADLEFKAKDLVTHYSFHADFGWFGEANFSDTIVLEPNVYTYVIGSVCATVISHEVSF